MMSEFLLFYAVHSLERMSTSFTISPFLPTHTSRPGYCCKVQASALSHLAFA
jgi:hypothetical protein